MTSSPLASARNRQIPLKLIICLADNLSVLWQINYLAGLASGMEVWVMECELLDKCRFFQLHSEGRELACKGFISQYCRGDKMKECKRKEFRKQHGSPPPDDMLPNGKRLAQPH